MYPYSILPLLLRFFFGQCVKPILGSNDCWNISVVVDSHFSKAINKIA